LTSLLVRAQSVHHPERAALTHYSKAGLGWGEKWPQREEGHIVWYGFTHVPSELLGNETTFLHSILKAKQSKQTTKVLLFIFVQCDWSYFRKYRNYKERKRKKTIFVIMKSLTHWL
jgi:hypothetical protein